LKLYPGYITASSIRKLNSYSKWMDTVLNINFSSLHPNNFSIYNLLASIRLLNLYFPSNHVSLGFKTSNHDQNKYLGTYLFPFTLFPIIGVHLLSKISLQPHINVTHTGKKKILLFFLVLVINPEPCTHAKPIFYNPDISVCLFSDRVLC
jgi:hypothetical protein